MKDGWYRCLAPRKGHLFLLFQEGKYQGKNANIQSDYPGPNFFPDEDSLFQYFHGKNPFTFDSDVFWNQDEIAHILETFRTHPKKYQPGPRVVKAQEKETCLLYGKDAGQVEQDFLYDPYQNGKTDKKSWEEGVARLTTQIKSSLRAWPICSVTGKPLDLRFHSKPTGDSQSKGLLIARWHCDCG